MPVAPGYFDLLNGEPSNDPRIFTASVKILLVD
jgi:hypothetical protein